jgi:hypothetical protein
MDTLQQVMVGRLIKRLALHKAWFAGGVSEGHGMGAPTG